MDERVASTPNRRVGWALCCTLWLGLLTEIAVAAETVGPRANGFRLDNVQIPIEEILPGGPPRDGIPALDHPKVVKAREVRLADDARVLGLEVQGEARAYPIAILNWHELVNDELGGLPVLVSYCPLCGTGMVFERRVAGQSRRFGVSGLLYRSDLLLFDRESESLWSQIMARAVAGPLAGERLLLLRSEHRSWREWVRAHPETTVLASETGYIRDYARSPYAGYATSDRLVFPVPVDRRYPAKMPTLGIRTQSGIARAYPASELTKNGGEVRERFAGLSLRVGYDSERQSFSVDAPSSVEVIEGYWFAWSAFHPDTTLFVAKRDRR